MWQSRECNGFSALLKHEVYGKRRSINYLKLKKKKKKKKKTSLGLLEKGN